MNYIFIFGRTSIWISPNIRKKMNEWIWRKCIKLKFLAVWFWKLLEEKTKILLNLNWNTIVIRNGKIVCKIVWIEYYLPQNLSSLKIIVLRLPQNLSDVNIECVGKPKQLYSLCDQLLGAIISSFYYSGINLLLIDYACCKLCNIWLTLFENNSRSYHYTGASHWRKNIVAVIVHGRVIDGNLKRQIKNRTL